MKRVVAWVRVVVLLGWWSARGWWLGRCNARLASELAWKTLAAEAPGAPPVSQVRLSTPDRPAVDPDLRRSMALLRHSIDQTLAQVRDGLDAMGDEACEQYIDSIAAAASGQRPLPGPHLLAARMQYVAVQMVALERAEARVAGGSR